MVRAWWPDAEHVRFVSCVSTGDPIWPIPAWSSDGTWLSVAASGVSGTPGEGTRLALVAADGSQAATLTQAIGLNIEPQWQP